MTADELVSFLKMIHTLDRNKLVKLFIKTRNAKSAAKKAFDLQESQFNQILDACENTMMKSMMASGETGFATEMGTVYTATTTKITIADDTAFFDFVRQQGDLDFFERRVSSTHVDQYMKQHAGQVPPGLNLFRENVARVRKANEKLKEAA